MVSKTFMILSFLSTILSVYADTPANCTYEDLLGQWNIYIGPAGTRETVKCSEKPGAFVKEVLVTFSPLNKLIKDSDGEEGNFTLIYNQGFEFEVGFRKFFAFFEWQKVNATYSKYWCNRTMYGWAHDALGREWNCIVAVKQTHKFKYKMIWDYPPTIAKNPDADLYGLDEMFKNDNQFIYELNKVQSSWEAGRYEQFEKLTHRDLLRMAGHSQGKISVPKLPKKELDAETKSKFKDLPDSYDWRNVGGVDYVSPIRNQGQCGSCYTFASMGMLEARIRIRSNNSQTPVFSTQEVVSCSNYSQGCAGGFPYLIAGKYAQDYGVIDEECYPYQGKDSSCQPTKPNCRRHYVDDYWYVGGYYGGCTEDLMKLALVKNGPVAVGFEVYPDFMHYKTGIYHHVFQVSSNSNNLRFDPFELTNHAVLVVGYGADPKSGEKYWTVKNSWGPEWGEKGYFRIRRGNDECGMESLAVESFPMTDM
ncbi:dipeptidyl peptidase 1-like [Styela clava]